MLWRNCDWNGKHTNKEADQYLKQKYAMYTDLEVIWFIDYTGLLWGYDIKERETWITRKTNNRNRENNNWDGMLFG